MPTKPTPQPPSGSTKIRQTGPKQAELLDRFAHLRRQREAGRMAERILRLVSSADPEVGEMALEIAATAVRMNQEPESNGATETAAVK